MNKDKKLLLKQIKIEMARRNFFEYCKLIIPNFYKDNRKYLKELCETLQKFIEDENKKFLIINCPPRHGKSLTAQCFTQWLLGKNKLSHIMTASYNEKLSTQFSKNVRNTIQTAKSDDKYAIVYNDIFPDTNIKYGDGSMNLWSVEGSFNSYLATSPSGSATGFGASILIMDDIIKNADEANNAMIKDDHWDWFRNTMFSRVEKGGKFIIIMTRWASDDLAGRFMQWLDSEDISYDHINMKAIINEEKQEMLCEEVLDYKGAMMIKSGMAENIFMANYQQVPIDLEGRLYDNFLEYDKLPQFNKICCYIDTADKGSDYLCAIVYGAYNNEAYILDVLYTQDKMALTEPKVADMLLKNNVNECLIEGNNGGEGFARSVDRILRQYGWNKCIIKTFHQNKNKESRILSNASWICNHMYFPHNWNNKWKNYYSAMFSYQAQGKNLHDDAPDATTGVAEQFNMTQGKRKIKI